MTWPWHTCPLGVLPDGTFEDAGQLLGQVLSAPLARGEALAGHRLTAPPAWSVPPGTMPLPVRFTDPGATALLTAGQHIDVLASSGPGLDDVTAFASAELVATEVLVLEVIAPDSGDGGILDTPAGDADGSLVLLAADRASAMAIAGAQARANLGVPHASAPAVTQTSPAASSGVSTEPPGPAPSWSPVSRLEWLRGGSRPRQPVALRAGHGSRSAWRDRVRPPPRPPPAPPRAWRAAGSSAGRRRSTQLPW